MSSSPSPLQSGEIVQHGLHHLIQHNSNTSYPQEQYDHDEGVHLQSNYGSPVPEYHGQQPRFAYQHQHQDSGLGIQYEGYNAEYQGLMYHDQYSTPATSPPTPHEMLRTRSGLAIQRVHQNPRPMPEARSRRDKSPKSKKVKKEKVKAEKKVAKLEKPLSELTKDWKHVPVADIEAYVNRSAEVRRKEVDEGKQPGKVKRPMNSFMLYRKAYQNRTKDWCLQNNHQVVSQVCGDSWPLEPDEVKEKFTEWARIERINHQNAHPGYKFSPTKPGTARSSKRKVSEEPMSNESDLDDFDWQRGQSRRPKKSRTPRSEMSVAYPSTKSAYKYSSKETSMEPNHTGYNRSSYQASNPGRPLPVQYNQADLHAGQYYQQNIQSNSLIPGAEDVIIRKTAAPGVHSHLGLPGGQEYDMMNPYPQYEASLGQEHRIDPSLIAQDQALYDGGHYGEPQLEGVYFGGSHNGDQQWQAPYGMIDRATNDPSMPYLESEQNLDGMLIQDHQMHVLKGHHKDWQVNESLDAGQEFDKWMEEE